MIGGAAAIIWFILYFRRLVRDINNRIEPLQNDDSNNGDDDSQGATVWVNRHDPQQLEALGVVREKPDDHLHEVYVLPNEMPSDQIHEMDVPKSEKPDSHIREMPPQGLMTPPQGLMTSPTL